MHSISYALNLERGNHFNASWKVSEASRWGKVLSLCPGHQHRITH
jgi:hypothetical protein